MHKTNLRFGVNNNCARYLLSCHGPSVAFSSYPRISFSEKSRWKILPDICRPSKPDSVFVHRGPFRRSGHSIHIVVLKYILYLYINNRPGSDQLPKEGSRKGTFDDDDGNNNNNYYYYYYYQWFYIPPVTAYTEVYKTMVIAFFDSSLCSAR